MHSNDVVAWVNLRFRKCKAFWIRFWTLRKTSEPENSLTMATTGNASFDFCCCCRSRIKRTIVPNEYNANNCIKSMYSLWQIAAETIPFLCLSRAACPCLIYLFCARYLVSIQTFTILQAKSILYQNTKRRKKEWNPVGAHTRTHMNICDL